MINLKQKLKMAAFETKIASGNGIYGIMTHGELYINNYLGLPYWTKMLLPEPIIDFKLGGLIAVICISGNVYFENHDGFMKLMTIMPLLGDKVNQVVVSDKRIFAVAYEREGKQKIIVYSIDIDADRFFVCNIDGPVLDMSFSGSDLIAITNETDYNIIYIDTEYESSRDWKLADSISPLKISANEDTYAIYSSNGEVNVIRKNKETLGRYVAVYKTFASVKTLYHCKGKRIYAIDGENRLYSLYISEDPTADFICKGIKDINEKLMLMTSNKIYEVNHDIKKSLKITITEYLSWQDTVSYNSEIHGILHEYYTNHKKNI